MSKADKTSSTPAPTMPSVHMLGRCLAGVNADYVRLEASNGDHGKALRLLERREETLFELISTLPAKSIADAAVQIGVACIYTDILASCEWSQPDTQEWLGRLHDALRRIALSVLPHIAAAADLDMQAMGWEGSGRLRAAEFSKLERVA